MQVRAQVYATEPVLYVLFLKKVLGVTSAMWRGEKTSLFLLLNLQVRRLELSEDPLLHTETRLRDPCMGTCEGRCAGVSRGGRLGGSTGTMAGAHCDSSEHSSGGESGHGPHNTAPSSRGAEADSLPRCEQPSLVNFRTSSEPQKETPNPHLPSSPFPSLPRPRQPLI